MTTVLGDVELETILSASAAIPGWTSDEDAKQIALASYALPGNATIVEVGVFMGRSSVLLALPRRLRGSGKVHCVDPFDCSGDAFSVPYYLQELQASGYASLETAFRVHIAALKLDPWIEVHKGTACDVAVQWSEPIDLLMLDGDQSVFGARAAYTAWVRFLRVGGTIILQNTRDRVYADGHEGNRRLAVEELVAPHFDSVRQVGATTVAVKALTGPVHSARPSAEAT